MLFKFNNPQRCDITTCRVLFRRRVQTLNVNDVSAISFHHLKKEREGDIITATILLFIF